MKTIKDKKIYSRKSLKIIDLTSISPNGVMFKTTNGKWISKWRLIYIIKHNRANVIVSRIDNTVIAAKGLKKTYLRCVPNKFTSDNVSTLPIEEAFGLPRRANKEHIVHFHLGFKKHGHTAKTHHTHHLPAWWVKTQSKKWVIFLECFIVGLIVGLAIVLILLFA